MVTGCFSSFISTKNFFNHLFQYYLTKTLFNNTNYTRMFVRSGFIGLKSPFLTSFFILHSFLITLDISFTTVCSAQNSKSSTHPQRSENNFSLKKYFKLVDFKKVSGIYLAYSHLYNICHSSRAVVAERSNRTT